MVDGNGTETGHIIVTTIGGRNGQPKQVLCSSILHSDGKYIVLLLSDIAVVALLTLISIQSSSTS